MRFKKYPLLILLFFFLPLLSQAATVSYSGCWEVSRESNVVRARSLSLDPKITLDNSASGIELTYYITLENVDPDLMIPDYYDEGAGIDKGENSITFEATIPAGTSRTISIDPFYEDDDDDFYFVAMSDNQVNNTYDSVNPTFLEILDQVDIVNPLFITNSGDLIKGDADASIVDTQLGNFMDVINQLPTTYFTVPGNHDYSADFAEYEKYLGSQEYSFNYSIAHFLGLNSATSTVQGEILTPELNNAESDLATATQAEKIVFFHHALSSPTWASLPIQYLSSINRDQIAEVMDEQSVDLVINGHNHGYDYRLIDHSQLAAVTNGFYQLVTGGAGGTINQPDGYFHFDIMHVTSDGITPYPIPKGKFDVNQSWSRDNDGTEDENILTLKNEGTVDLPYLRPKFKLNKEITHLKAKDQNGNYLPVYSQVQEEYAVAYVETELAQSEEKAITVSLADEIHKDNSNTVYNDGSVHYGTTPENSSTIVNLKAKPKKKTTVISQVNWATDGLSGSWQEQAAGKYINTEYTFSSLRPNTVYTVEEDGKFYKRFITDREGNGQFTFSEDKKNRSLSFRTSGRAYGQQVMIAPHSVGASHVRRFNATGDLMGQFYAFGSSQSGNFQPYWGDFKNNGRDQILVSRNTMGKPSKIRLFKSGGKKLAQKTPFGIHYTQGLLVAVNDINRDKKDEIIVAPQGKGQFVKIFKYQRKKGKIKLIAKKKFSNTPEAVSLAVGQINGKGNKEIVLSAAAGDSNLVKIYKLTQKNKIRLLAEKQLDGRPFKEGINVAAGSLRGRARSEMVFSDASGAGRPTLIYYLNKKNNLKKLAQVPFNADQVLCADVNSKGKFKDELIAYSRESGQLSVFKYKNNADQLKSIFSSRPFRDYADIGVGVANLDADYRAEIMVGMRSGGSDLKIFDFSGTFEQIKAFIPYDSRFTGGVNIAQ